MMDLGIFKERNREKGKLNFDFFKTLLLSEKEKEGVKQMGEYRVRISSLSV